MKPIVDLDALQTLHAEQGLCVVTLDRRGTVYLAEENAATWGVEGSVDSAIALTSELLRLARLGQRVEKAAADAVARADRRDPGRMN